MKILIVSATYLEIEPLLLQFRLEQEVNQKLKSYSYKNHQIDVLIPGVGMTCTAYWLGKTLATQLYDIALNFGLAGSFDEKITIGDVVHVTSDQISELGAEDGESFLSLIDMDLINDEDYSLTHTKMENSILPKNTVINQLKKVSGITVNTTHGAQISIQKIKKLFAPQIESMEGAAFLYACLLEGISCAQIRVISNKVEKRNKENWNIPLAVKNLCSTALQILNSKL
ncbi:MAG: futalosine hydrolase [Flavobacteriales bacterium CG_4_10_14_0_2_um_filter_32_8]|nr:MAG: futalosine hydrolase [Flavobacteriales bacterium CG_4_10_14_0_2_um_filter_32_8]